MEFLAKQIVNDLKPFQVLSKVQTMVIIHFFYIRIVVPWLP